jgi:hypothetical protein
MKGLFAPRSFHFNVIYYRFHLRIGVVVNVSQCASPGPAPLATIIRPKITAPTAVAARIVKNQNRRLPSRRNGLALLAGPGRPEATADFGRGSVAARTAPIILVARRCGEIQGQIVWNWRLLRTPVRPYRTSTTAAKIASSRKPIMMMPPIYGQGNAHTRWWKLPRKRTESEGQHGGNCRDIGGPTDRHQPKPGRLDWDDAGRPISSLYYSGGGRCQMNSSTRQGLAR